MLELDTKLEDFANIRMEISNYRQIVKDNYKSFYFIESSPSGQYYRKIQEKIAIHNSVMKGNKT